VRVVQRLPSAKKPQLSVAHRDNGAGVRLPLLTGGLSAATGFAGALRCGLSDLRVGPVDADAATELLEAAACASPVPLSMTLALSLLDSEAADAAAYAARTLLIVSPKEEARNSGARLNHVSLILDDAPLSAAASRDLAATLYEGVSEMTARALVTQLHATITETSAAGAVSAAFARAFAQGVCRGRISRLELKIQGHWSEDATKAWTHALRTVRTDSSPSIFSRHHHCGLRLCRTILGDHADNVITA
jgi:hypothetical protein